MCTPAVKLQGLMLTRAEFSEKNVINLQKPKSWLTNILTIPLFSTATKASESQIQKVYKKVLKK